MLAKKSVRRWREAVALFGPLAPIVRALEPFEPEIVRSWRNARMRAEGGVLYLGSSSLVHSGMHMITDDGRVFANDFQWSLEGMNALLSALRGSALSSSWYIAPYSGAAAPSESLTHATFASTQTEVTNYDESTRVAYTIGADASTVSGQSVLAATAASTFTVSTGGANIRGYGLMDVSAKSSASAGGVLLGASDLLGSAVPFTASATFTVTCNLILDT